MLTEGLPRLEAEIAKALGTPDRVLPGETAFRLYDTFGLPYDFIEDTAATQDVTVDRQAYERAMEGQRGKARAQSAFGGGRKGADFTVVDDPAFKGAGDHFEGYTTTRVSGVPIVAMFDEQRQPVDGLTEGDAGYIALTRTPFYLEAGGQVSDSGRIFGTVGSSSATVEGLVRTGAGSPRAHRVLVDAGALKVRDIVTAEVDAETEAHLLAILRRHCDAGAAAIVATHSTALANAASRVIRIADGRIVDDSRSR